MPQLLLQGFPDGAMRIGSTLQCAQEGGRVTYFVGPDSYFSHRRTDAAGTLGAGDAHRQWTCARSQVEVSGLGIAHRTLMHWTRNWTRKSPGSFMRPAAGARAR